MRGPTRTLAVLFTDLVGSTDLLAQLGPGPSEDVRGRYFAAMRAATASHRGTEVKTLGDGLMVVFDTAGDAIGCAVAMQRAIAGLNRRDRARHLQLRVGVSAGEVMCDEADYFGMPVVEASRLCDAAGGDGVLIADIARTLAGAALECRLDDAGTMSLKGIPVPVRAWAAAWQTVEDGVTLRVALAEDSVLLREGIARVLESEAIDVVLQSPDAAGLLAGLPGARPHVVVLDVRMPPTFTTEGLDAARRIRAEHPEVGVLVLSASVDPGAARRLVAGGRDGVGYLLKERVGEINELVGAIRTVAAGGCVIDDELAGRLSV